MLFNLIDLGAVVLLAALVTTLLCGIHVMNALSAAPLMPLSGLMADLRATGSDAPAMGWSYVMVLSTLLPTAAHFCLAVIGVVAIHPLRWTRRLFAAPLIHGAEVTDKHREVMALMLALWGTLILLALYFAAQMAWPDLLGRLHLWALGQMDWLIAALGLR